MSMESSELCQQNHIDNLFYLYLFIFSSAFLGMSKLNLIVSLWNWLHST